MSNYNIVDAKILVNPSNGTPVGFLGSDGREYMCVFGSAYGAAGTVGAYQVSGTLTMSGQLTMASGQKVAATVTDISGTPGNGTVSQLSGKAAFAAGASTITITNTLVTAASTVLCMMEGADATLTSILRVVPGAGSFVVTGNAAATAATKFSFLVIG